MEKLENQPQIVNMLTSLIDGGECDTNVGVEDLQLRSLIEVFDIEEIRLITIKESWLFSSKGEHFQVISMEEET